MHTFLNRVPEIGDRVFQMGCLPILENAIHCCKGHSAKSMREMGMLALSLLSKSKETVKNIGTPRVISGMTRELSTGTDESQQMIISMLLTMHGKYGAAEAQLLDNILDHIVRLLKSGPWMTKNLCCKCICVLYKYDFYIFRIIACIFYK